MNIENVDYSTKIPNNVNLTEDRQVLRALESWHPGYIDWWKDMGPQGFQESLVYLRTAVSVDPKGWAKFDYVKMPEYRWGVLLAPQELRTADSISRITMDKDTGMDFIFGSSPVPRPHFRVREIRAAC